jgi:hypothetical protein
MWTQQAYLKASNTRESAYFGFSLSLSGNTLAVGAPGESSNATGVNGSQVSTSADNAGAVYIFARTGTTWAQEAYLKASNSREDTQFGVALAVYEDSLAVGAVGDSSNATGINGNQADVSMSYAGAVYLFARTATTWKQEAYIKASNTRSTAEFGESVALSKDFLAVGASGDSSNATGVDGNQLDASLRSAGAVYVFNRVGPSWVQGAYLKASNVEKGARFGGSIALFADVLAVGAPGALRTAHGSGAVFVFGLIGDSWKQEALLKSSRLDQLMFGASVSVFGDTLAVVNGNGAPGDSTGVDMFVRRNSMWTPSGYFDGGRASVALSGDTLAVGAQDDSSNATGVNGNRSDTSMPGSGAVFVYR